MADSNSEISVCALVPYPPDTTPSQRFRLEQWIPYLQAEGISVDLFPFVDGPLMRLLYQPGRWAAKAAALSKALVRRFADVAAARRYDVVFVHRAVCIIGPAVLERVLPAYGKPVIFDFDDAIYLLDTTRANRHAGWLKFPGKTSAICRHSTHVVVGNAFLAEYARRYNPRVTVIPTSVDTTRYRPTRKPGPGGRVVIGWTGSATSQTHLEMFAPTLRGLFDRRDVELRVISNRKPEIEAIPFTWTPWRPETESEDIARFDVGIMPLPDDRWAKGKCALKLLQYMGLGIPSVSSAVGANCDVIQHGENGLLARNPEEWIACLETLVDGRDLRARIGEAARRTVEERYSMTRCAGQFADLVRGLVAGAQGGLVHATSEPRGVSVSGKD
jgi:glycosyltransferase involved in cell wall biosynthesis